MTTLCPMLLLPGILPDWRLALAFGFAVSTATSTLTFCSFSMSLGFEMPFRAAPRARRAMFRMLAEVKMSTNSFTACAGGAADALEGRRTGAAGRRNDAAGRRSTRFIMDRKQHDWAKATVIACMMVMLGGMKQERGEARQH